MVKMNVTLNLEDELVSRAQALASARNMTVPEMLERMLRIATEPPKDEDLPPITRRTRGILPPLTDEQVRQILDEEKMRKYGP